jgi:GxxExxY protein
MDHDLIAQAVIDSPMRVHTKLGPGLLESAYEACLAYELTRRGLAVALQVPLALDTMA